MYVYQPDQHGWVLPHSSWMIQSRSRKKTSGVIIPPFKHAKKELKNPFLFSEGKKSKTFHTNGIIFHFKVAKSELRKLFSPLSLLPALFKAYLFEWAQFLLKCHCAGRGGGVRLRYISCFLSKMASARREKRDFSFKTTDRKLLFSFLSSFALNC